MNTREVDDLGAHWSYAELWDTYPIPSRPDSEELAFEENYLTLLPPHDVSLMILGSTIEYRSLCKRLGIHATVVDFSRDNFDSLSSYSKEKFTDETFIESDWLAISYEDTFDFILGHRPFNVIRHDQLLTLFQKMHTALKKGGTFFCRGNVRPLAYEDQLDSIVDTWAFVPNRPYRLFSYLEVALYFRCADEQGYLDYPKARETIRRYREEGRISDEDYNDIFPLISMPEGTKFRSYVPLDEFEASLRQAGFTSIEVYRTSHEFTQHMPIYRLVK